MKKNRHLSKPRFNSNELIVMNNNCSNKKWENEFKVNLTIKVYAKNPNFGFFIYSELDPPKQEY